MPKYKDTPQNRKLGRVGKTYRRGRPKKRKPTKKAKGRPKKRKTKTRRRKRTTYKDTAQNRRLGRVGQKYANRRRSIILEW